MFVLLLVLLDRLCSEVAWKSTGYPLHSPVSPSLPLPCVTVCHQIPTVLYTVLPPPPFLPHVPAVEMSTSTLIYLTQRRMSARLDLMTQPTIASEIQTKCTFWKRNLTPSDLFTLPYWITQMVSIL